MRHRVANPSKTGVSLGWDQTVTTIVMIVLLVLSFLAGQAWAAELRAIAASEYQARVLSAVEAGPETPSDSRPEPGAVHGEDGRPKP